MSKVESALSLQAAASFVIILLSSAPQRAMAWGSSSSSSSYAIYGNKLSRDWLSNSQGIAISVHGCLWSYMMDKYNDDARCLYQNSQDGTEVWYMMSNCRRAQVAFSIYASDSTNSPQCTSTYFKESFVTKSSAMEFVAYMENAGYTMGDSTEYPQCGSNRRRDESDFEGERDLGGGGGGGGGNNQGGGNNNNKNNNQNQQRSNTPIALSCASDGSFQLEQFADPYCLTRTGTQTNALNTFNQDMANLNCFNVYGNNNKGSISLVQYLIYISQSCSSHDSGLCQDSLAAQERHSYTSKSSSTNTAVAIFQHNPMASTGHSWFTKLKYVTGGLLLLASFVMFTGILFTNRRRRRALMQRKYRNSRRSQRGSSGGADNRSRRSSRSASKARDSGSRKSSSRSRRSKSRDTRGGDASNRSPAKDRSADTEPQEHDGIMT